MDTPRATFKPGTEAKSSVIKLQRTSPAEEHSERPFEFGALTLREDPLLSIDESAKYLGGISPWTIRSYLSSGRLKRTKVGRRTMIRTSQLDLFARNGE